MLKDTEQERMAAKSISPLNNMKNKTIRKNWTITLVDAWRTEGVVYYYLLSDGTYSDCALSNNCVWHNYTKEEIEKIINVEKAKEEHINDRFSYMDLDEQVEYRC